MANNRSTYQQQNNVSINKERLIDLAQDPDLSKSDYKVLLMLFTELNGWRETYDNRARDPKNYKRIDIDKISDTLDISRKKVKKAVDKLIEFSIIEKGSSRTVQKGYRFTF